MPSRYFTVGTTQADLAAVARTRRSLTIFNTHATATLYVKEGSEVSSTNGIPIPPQGHLGITFEGDGEYVWERFVIISNTASTGVVVVEGYAFG